MKAGEVQLAESSTPIRPTFGKRFLDDHAGRIIAKPEVALVELVANAWDAGARCVTITWPESREGMLVIEDDGVGLAAEDFVHRWSRMNYDRRENQGNTVTFPTGVDCAPRLAFGRNGKGRHAMFAFNSHYNVRTSNGGRASTWKITRTDEPDSPFKIERLATEETQATGLRLECMVAHGYLSQKKVAECIGSRFAADPDFRVEVNGKPVNLSTLGEHVVSTRQFSMDGQEVTIQCVDGQRAGLTTAQSGIAWWVNKRRVGPVSWSILGDKIVDGRSEIAKRYLFIVHVDGLGPWVKADWSGFRDDSTVDKVQERVAEELGPILKEVAGSTRRTQKIAVLQEKREDVRALSNLSQDVVGDFLDEVQRIAPTIRRKDLDSATEVLIQLEQSRHGSRLLSQLSELDPSDLEALTEILDSWTVREAQIVLNELKARLDLIDRLDALCEDPRTKELKQLQPLFERGLWIFGPEFESIEYTSNKRLATVLAELFKSRGFQVESPTTRPDFVVLPKEQSALSTFSCDAFDDGEASKIAKVLVIELKKGGSTIGPAEMEQARGYVRSLRKSGKVNADATISAFVLGAKVDDELLQTGKDLIVPQTFERVINRAKARLFRLREKLERHARTTDPEVQEVLRQQSLTSGQHDRAV